VAIARFGSGKDTWLARHRPGLPVVGNMFQVQATRLHQILEGWARKYGDYYRFRLGKRRFLVVADPEAIAQSLRDRPEGFQRTERLNKAARNMGFGGVFSANGEQWKRQRPMVMAGFDPAHIRKYFPTLVKVTERFVRRWQRAASSDHTARNFDRPDGRPHALHRGRHRRPPSAPTSTPSSPTRT
jgi:cytochrome P450